MQNRIIGNITQDLLTKSFNEMIQDMKSHILYSYHCNNNSLKQEL